jgi:hypothetical protein
LLIAALLCSPARGFAQKQQGLNPQQINIPADGSELFRALLDRAKIKPVTQQEIRNLHRFDDVIIIFIGDQTRTRFVFGDPMSYARDALASGGAVLVAADTQLQIPLGWQVTPGPRDWAIIEPARVECRDKNSVHRVKNANGKEVVLSDCPYVVPFDPNDVPNAAPEDRSPSLVFKGLTRIATNVPSYLDVRHFTGQCRYALARFPAKSVSITAQGEQALPENALFAAGGDGPDPINRTEYRFLVMADNSVFINLMLLEKGTDNLELAYRTIDYLRGPNGRKRCLFIENGKIIEHFDDVAQAFKKSKPIPIPDFKTLQEKVTTIGDAFVDDLQTRNVPNNILLRMFRHPAIVRFFIIVGAIFATWYLLRRVFATRKPTDLPPAPPVAAAATGPPGVFERRQKELIRRDNLYEPVRDLVREFFVSIGIHGTQHGPKLPKLVISDAVRKPESLRLAIKDFWRLAYGPPQEVTIARWRELEPYFERLQKAHADGKWHFVLAGAPVAMGV